MDRKLYGKVIFRGVIKTLTGLHIGASKETLEIGGLDLPVIKHPITKVPYIPGSSLKGKLRSLLEMKLHTEGKVDFNRNVGTGENAIWIHVCDSEEDAYNCEVCRVFGSSGKGKKPDNTPNKNLPARIKVRDVHFTKYWENMFDESKFRTDIKFENSLDRITSASNPRQIERVPAGTEFEFEIIYNVENLNQLKDDLINILSAMELLEDDALGGHGSRGYGRLKFYFAQITAKPVKAYFNGEKPKEIVKIEWDPEKRTDDQGLKDLKEAKKALLQSVQELRNVFAEIEGGHM